MDRRILKTKEAIKTAYKTLLMEHTTSKITITEIAKTANIDRKTFYLHYDSIEDIMKEIMTENLSELEDLLNESGIGEMSFDVNTIMHSMNVCIIKDIKFYTAIAHRTDFDLFVKKMKEILTISTMKTLSKTTELSEKELYIYSKFLISGITDVYADCFRNNTSLSLDELGELLSNIISSGIQSFIKENP